MGSGHVDGRKCGARGRGPRCLPRSGTPCDAGRSRDGAAQSVDTPERARSRMTRVPPRVWHRLIVALFVALGLRVAWLAIAHALGSPTVRIYHLQTAAVWWLVSAIVLMALRPDPPGITAVPAPARLPRWLPLLLLAGTFALYWRALHLGWLSDDYVLRTQARDWRL